MTSARTVFWLGLFAVAAAVFVGCGGEEASQPPGGTSSSDAWKQGLDEEAVAALSQLSDSDREAALEQKVCPVSGKPLGSMGKPIKVEVEDGQVFVCCAACVDTVRENPEEYLQKPE